MVVCRRACTYMYLGYWGNTSSRNRYGTSAGNDGSCRDTFTIQPWAANQVVLSPPSGFAGLAAGSGPSPASSRPAPGGPEQGSARRGKQSKVVAGAFPSAVPHPGWILARQLPRPQRQSTPEARGSIDPPPPKRPRKTYARSTSSPWRPDTVSPVVSAPALPVPARRLN